MKAISKAGRGDYFFIDAAENIPKIVSKAIHGLIDVTGTNSLLKIRGKNGLIIKKIVGHEDVDLTNGYQFGDLHADNLKQILVQAEISPINSGETEVINYELSFLNNDKIFKIQGSANIEFTEDDSKLKEQNIEVLIAIKLQESAKINHEIVTLIDDGNIEEAIFKKSKIIEELQELESKDTSGMIKKTITKSLIALEDLKKKKNLNLVKKEFDDIAYKEECLSVCGYNSGNDSEDEELKQDFNNLISPRSTDLEELDYSSQQTPSEIVSDFSPHSPTE